MTILVTGASGHLGRLIVQQLIARGADPADVVAGARDTAKIADLGVATVALDYTDPASVAAAVDGVETVVLVSSSSLEGRAAQHANVIAAAKDAGVSKLIYTSAPRATTTDLVLAADHRATEETIVVSGVPAVILRNNWYSENYAADLQRARETGVVTASVGDGRVASASRVDFAEAAAVVALDEGHIGEVYELGGDETWSYSELASAISEVIGRDVSYVGISTDEHVAALQAAGLDAGTAGFVAAIDTGIAWGALAETDGTLSRLIGRPTTPLVEGLRSVA